MRDHSATFPSAQVEQRIVDCCATRREDAGAPVDFHRDLSRFGGGFLPKIKHPVVRCTTVRNEAELWRYPRRTGVRSAYGRTGRRRPRKSSDPITCRLASHHSRAHLCDGDRRKASLREELKEGTARSAIAARPMTSRGFARNTTLRALALKDVERVTQQRGQTPKAAGLVAGGFFRAHR